MAWCFEMGCSVWQRWWSGWGWGGTRVQLVENSLSLLGKQWTLDTRRTRAWAEAGSGPTLHEGGIVKFSLVWRAIPCMTTPPHPLNPSMNPSPATTVTIHLLIWFHLHPPSFFFFSWSILKPIPDILYFTYKYFLVHRSRLRAPPSNPST